MQWLGQKNKQESIVSVASVRIIVSISICISLYISSPESSRYHVHISSPREHRHVLHGSISRANRAHLRREWTRNVSPGDQGQFSSPRIEWPETIW
jgi:hypothetical protein